MKYANFFFAFLLFHSVLCLPEQGVWDASFDKAHNIQSFKRSLFMNSTLTVRVNCDRPSITVNWILRKSPCSNEYNDIESNAVAQKYYLNNPSILQSPDLTYTEVEYITGRSIFKCEEDHKLVHNNEKLMKVKTINPAAKPEDKKTKGDQKENTSKADAKPKDDKQDKTPSPGTDAKPKTDTTSGKSRRKRADPPKPTNTSGTATVTEVKNVQITPQKQEKDDYMVMAWSDGCYILIIEINNRTDFTANVTVEVESRHGYLGVLDWPFLIFYGVAGILYIILGILWLVLLACNWRDILRVQFWIGGVVVLGMLEAAVYFGEYENISKTGKSVRGAVIFAELVSAAKRTLARMLVIIVSLGFGIVKPRLGQAFHRVLCVGGLYFIVSSVEGCMRRLKSPGNASTDELIAAVPLAVIDAVICWWIFSALVQTTRTLRLRRNIVKLSLYRHFTNTLIFAVLISVVFMIWSTSQHKLKHCLTDWKELWVDEAFWHILFLLLMCIIMLLWRPSSNNQRYAFSPLLDAADEDEDDENVMHDAFEGMKMRGTKTQTNGSPRQKETTTPAEDDLKWVEENIPSSLADKALPSLLDSDEEIMTTKLERSKME